MYLFLTLFIKDMCRENLLNRLKLTQNKNYNLFHIGISTHLNFFNLFLSALKVQPLFNITSFTHTNNHGPHLPFISPAYVYDVPVVCDKLVMTYLSSVIIQNKKWRYSALFFQELRLKNKIYIPCTYSFSLVINNHNVIHIN